jgi:hypothetical protein
MLQNLFGSVVLHDQQLVEVVEIQHKLNYILSANAESSQTFGKQQRFGDIVKALPTQTTKGCKEEQKSVSVTLTRLYTFTLLPSDVC